MHVISRPVQTIRFILHLFRFTIYIFCVSLYPFIMVLPAFVVLGLVSSIPSLEIGWEHRQSVN